jgi:hypothetical protein
MARVIRIGDIGDYATQQMEKLLRASVLETDNLVKQASPVKSGRFRESWQVGENSATGGVAPEGTYSSVPPISRIGYQQERLGNVYSVHNNLPYAERLANGWSKQTAGAPGGQAGWIQGIAKDVQGRVRIAADRIGRQS